MRLRAQACYDVTSPLDPCQEEAHAVVQCSCRSSILVQPFRISDAPLSALAIRP
jgi:hypothetical protein